MDFTGSRITYYSRTYTDQGEIAIVITDRDTGETVVQDTATCYDTKRGYAKEIYTSPTLPTGNYTMRLTQVSGTYLVVDAFKVFASDEAVTHNVLTAPATLQWADGSDVSDLQDGKTLEITMPICNAGGTALNATAIMMLMDVTGGYVPVDIVTEELVIPTGDFTYRGQYTLPASVEGKALHMVILTQEEAITYVITVKGGDLDTLNATDAVWVMLDTLNQLANIVYGDVDGDGEISSSDARLVLQYAVKKISGQALALSAADVSGDGTVDSTDARWILQAAVKKIDQFPIEKS